MLRSLPQEAAVGAVIAIVFDELSEVNIVPRAVRQVHIQHSLDFVLSFSLLGCYI